jgi:hypothetical protein
MPVIKLAAMTPFGAYQPEVLAEVTGPFGVHMTVQGEPGQYNVTHVPTGYAILERVTYDDAVAAVRELVDGGLDWSFTDKVGLSPELKAQGKALRAKYKEDPVVHRQRR